MARGPWRAACDAGRATVAQAGGAVHTLGALCSAAGAADHRLRHVGVAQRGDAGTGAVRDATPVRIRWRPRRRLCRRVVRALLDRLVDGGPGGPGWRSGAVASMRAARWAYRAADVMDVGAGSPPAST